ncbi:MAG: hypothetical protein DVS81_03035 [Candidatus Accumulibacter meliphilus]|jgi:hypothetical protein|uniref:Uncharacterized protein n=1 Tax=Candidatus Accumulibacter meliphilus TaxID=2211374 RepID=A0A369XR98_9PROT|nr:MAG: hypothetical protein DVS81_03035 [Candidatus Accumulibacter meliphilus]
MIEIELLERQIAELDETSFRKLREWFLEFDQSRWDQKLTDDSSAGKLQFLVNAALGELESGRTRDL